MEHDKPRLAPGAIPTIFPDLPSYLTTNVPKKRRCPDMRKNEIDNRLRSIEEEETIKPK